MSNRKRTQQYKCPSCGATLNVRLSHDPLVPATPQPEPPRRVIWFWAAGGDHAQPVEAARLAITSGLVTHVLMSVGHRRLTNRLNEPQVLEVKRLAEANGVKTILCRMMWDREPHEDSVNTRLDDAEYYAREIGRLRKEQCDGGFYECCLDTEPYFPSEVHVTFHRPHEQQLPRTFDAIQVSIAEALCDAGPVDYVLPAGKRNVPFHPYNALRGLGTFPISESTYYVAAQAYYPFDITGRYVRTTDTFVYHSVEAALATTGDIMLYPYETETVQVAEALATYAEAQR